MPVSELHQIDRISIRVNQHEHLAIVGSFEGTAFVDVTDGLNPVYLGTLPSSAPGDFGNIWGDIRVYENTAYVVSEALDFSTYDPAAGTIDGFGDVLGVVREDR